MAESCVFPEGEFLWGVQVCGEEAVTLVRDYAGVGGWVCGEHARLVSESRQGKDLCVGDDDTCPEEIDWSMARPGVDGRCTRHAEEWEADNGWGSRLAFCRSFLRFGR